MFTSSTCETRIQSLQESHMATDHVQVRSHGFCHLFFLLHNVSIFLVTGGIGCFRNWLLASTTLVKQYGHLEISNVKFEHVTNIHDKKIGRIWLSSSRCKTRTFGPYHRIEICHHLLLLHNSHKLSVNFSYLR